MKKIFVKGKITESIECDTFIEIHNNKANNTESTNKQNASKTNNSETVVNIEGNYTKNITVGGNHIVIKP